MPRTFTPAELQSLTHGAYQALPAEEKAAFDTALIQHWVKYYAEDCAIELSRDLDPMDASHRRGDLGV